jgi:hypothetical protein
MATNTAREMWKSKHPSEQLPKEQNLTISPITAEIEVFLYGLPDDIRNLCILAIKNKNNLFFAIIERVTV